MIPTFLAQLEFNGSQFYAPFTTEWLGATLCSMLVGIATGILGCFFVLRRMALIGDALAHAILPGVVIAFIFTHDTNVYTLLLGALLAGLTTAVLINVVGRFSRTKEDSAIGIVFTALFALGIVLISFRPQGTHFDLQCFLFGDPLAVGNPDLVMMATIAPLVILVITLLYHPLKLISFDPIVAAAMGLPVMLFHYLLMGMLSATVVVGLKTTGVVLVVAMVITPASAAYQLTNRFQVMLVLSALFGALSAGLGMSLAFVVNSPTGPAMVLVASAIFLLAMLFSPSHGVLFDRIRRLRLARHIAAEDVLKSIYRLSTRDWTTAEMKTDLVHIDEHKLVDISVATGLRLPRVRKCLQRLCTDGLLQYANGGYDLTSRGRRRAMEMVRAHRLWETYLIDRGFNVEDIHEQAEILEHAHELADEVDQTLGHPRIDPHGEKIPHLPLKSSPH